LNDEAFDFSVLYQKAIWTIQLYTLLVMVSDLLVVKGRS